MSRLVSVVLPVLNGAAVLDQTLAAVRAQNLGAPASVEVIVCDSGSRDGSIKIARAYDAEVVEIPPGRFSHGETRNLLMRQAQGEHVAFLTQDAVPAHERWLARLLDGFTLADDVALVFGPYRPRDDAPPMVARELTEWFHSFAPDGAARIDRLSPQERAAPPPELLGARGFFTDANGCVARAAWEAVPFRPVAYAEDRALALDVLRAGYAKVYLPQAAVIHSHDYSLGQWMRRSFDEARAMRDVYGWVASPRVLARNLRGNVMADWRWVHRAGAVSALGQASSMATSMTHHGARAAGGLLGGRSDRLPRRLSTLLSLEGRH